MGAFLLLGKEKPQCFRNENPDKNVQTSGQIYRKELNAMDNLFRHLKRNSKQMLSFMLAFVVLMENPVSA